MIPQPVSISDKVDFAYPTLDRLIYPLKDVEIGSHSIQNTSGGLSQHVWTLEVIDRRLTLYNDLGYSQVLEYGVAPDMLAMAFDQSMSPVYCLLNNSVASIKWRNTQTQELSILNIPNVSSIAMCLDMRHPALSHLSDVILAYSSAGNLYYRLQRDRYSVEYPLYLADDEDIKISAIGLSISNQVHFRFKSIS